MQQPGPGPVETRNVIIAIVLSIAIMLGWEFFFSGPQRAELQAERARIIEAQQQETQLPATPNADGEVVAPSTPASRDRETVLAQTAVQRLTIDTPSVDGTISLEGGRFDDLNLRQYNRTVEENSGEVTLLVPIGAAHGHDAFFGWETQNGESSLPLADASSLWRATEGATLTPDTPVTLSFDNGAGVTIERTIAVDADYMFTITDVVRNAGEAPVSVRPLGVVRRNGMPEDFRQQSIVHQGMVGAFGPNNSLHQSNFRDADKLARNKVRGRAGENERLVEETGTGGWFGITDHYWLAAIVPDQGEQISAYYDARTIDNVNSYRAAYRGQWRQAAAGGEVTYTQRFFAGAKRVQVLQDYQEALAIPRFDDAVDWGNFWFLTRPFFLWLLHPLALWAGNFGLGILLTTIVVKAILFPLVYQSFKAMAKMRGLAPKMKELQERYAADKPRQQQEILKLYQTEKVNPVSGCLPILLQIPVFFALYKTLSVTIEMRHAPFYGWINDLSAPDHTTIFNLFGLLPYDPTALPLIGGMLALGAWPILYGVTMWALQSLSPPPTDPVQAQVFRWLPILFTFMFAGFPAGLVIYWTWSNTLSMAQQYVIMRRQGVETQLDTFLAKLFKKPAAAE
jgi:YidC/Oxa1 family membrane protein insertase